MVRSGNPKNVGKTTTNLGTMAKSGMLPTPTSQDGQNSMLPISQKGRHTVIGFLMRTGQTSQLNPRFVAEMMGFPPDWTELPFLNGETKVSKDMATP
jgi:hypothetical protein